mmetsp:Transcript_1048/g.1363  ORF Transcript_1048/g.1363 Transcript_1048/m.1363 type:complete len:276 (-) Transcript_1048:417-1244(-)
MEPEIVKPMGVHLSSPSAGGGDDAKTSTDCPKRSLRVLVTGFCDWRFKNERMNIWRVRDNPSGRLLVGGSCESPPVSLEGVLPRILNKECPADWEFSFQVLPVIWGASFGVVSLSSYDVAIHIGLGVYDKLDGMLLEDGAVNLRRKADAQGTKPPSDLIDKAKPAGSHLRDEQMTKNVKSMNNAHFGSFTVKSIGARDDNAYLCNEVHYRALQALRHSRESKKSRLRAAYFLHIPYAGDGANGYEILGKAVASVILQLCRKETVPRDGDSKVSTT